jgi:DNA-binding transcriptional ArsR family regulator
VIEEAHGPAGSARRVFVAVANPTRRRLLLLLLFAGRAEITTTRLAELMPVPRQEVARHLVVLCRAGLARGRLVGPEMRYAMRPEALSTTAWWTAELAREWDRRLAAVKHLVERTNDPR